MKRPFFCLSAFLFSTALFAQDKWDLRKAVDYALANNISVKQADLRVRFSELDFVQSKASRWPSLNFNLNGSARFGRSENPTTGTLEDNNFFNSGLSLQSGVTLFNWFSIKNTIEANRLAIEADKAAVKKAQDDIALNVAVAYLQILLAKEQAGVAAVQVQQTQSQYEVIRKKVNAGVLPELNSAELEAQLARDSSALISTQAAIQQYILQMKALLNLDAGAPFDVVTPPVEAIPVESLAELQPEAVYALALVNLPQQRVNDLRIQSAEKNVDAAKGNMYPTFSGFANLNSNYIYFKRPLYAQTISGYENTLLRVDDGSGNIYTVQSPVITQGAKTGVYITPAGLGEQLRTNFGQGIGIGMQVPIFNGRMARTAWDRSKLNVQQLRLQKEADRQILKQDIYQAYTDAVAAIEKYNASKKSVAAAEKAYSFAEKRFNVNLLSTYDLMNTQNNLLRAKIEMLSAQFDYVFKMKLLEFYKGQGLKL